MPFCDSPTGRRLRALQSEEEAAAAAEFTLDFGVNPTVDAVASGAASSRVMAATALVVAGAFAML